MSRIRVLVVDDAVIVRRLVAKALEADPEFQVVGTASDGPLALQKIAELSPDVVTLDLDMPEMDGLKVLAEIRRRWRGLPAVIFTGMSEPGPAELEALALGANDCIVKVPHEGNMVHALKWVQETLGPRLKAIVAEWQLTVRSASAPARPPAPPVTRPAPVPASPTAPPAGAPPSPPAASPPPPASPPFRSTPPEVLVVAASTGARTPSRRSWPSCRRTSRSRCWWCSTCPSASRRSWRSGCGRAAGWMPGRRNRGSRWRRAPSGWRRRTATWWCSGSAASCTYS
ncbi:MAG: response regulator [Gemmatimonadetes bacterium]|nr:response regulator [Gemmatimonadota bacterium]